MLFRTTVFKLNYQVRGVLSPLLNSNRKFAALAEAKLVLESELESIRVAGTWKGERVITSKQGPRINVDGSRGGRTLVMIRFSVQLSFVHSVLFMLGDFHSLLLCFVLTDPASFLFVNQQLSMNSSDYDSIHMSSSVISRRENMKIHTRAEGINI